jgi:hypothetical protein
MMITVVVGIITGNSCTGKSWQEIKNGLFQEKNDEEERAKDEVYKKRGSGE